MELGITRLSRRPTAIFLRGCPNCGGPIDDRRLLAGLPCPSCLPINLVSKLELSNVDSIYNPMFIQVADVLREIGTLRENSIYEELYDLQKRVEDFAIFFEKAIGHKLWGFQRFWTKRYVKGENFAMTSPTGTGKTTFAMVAALYKICAENGEKVFITAPTKTLAAQIVSRLRKLAENLRANGIECRPRIITSVVPAHMREEVKDIIFSGDFNILVTTMAFLMRNRSKFSANARSYKLSLFVIDDIDAVFKSRKSLITMLTVAGFPEDIVNKVIELLIKRRRLLRRREREPTLLTEVQEQLEAVRSELENIETSQVIASSATLGFIRADLASIFANLVGVNVGSFETSHLRDIDDIVIPIELGLEEKAIRTLVREVVALAEALEDGMFIFVPKSVGESAKLLAEYIAKKLNDANIPARAVYAGKREFVDIREIVREDGSVELSINIGGKEVDPQIFIDMFQRGDLRALVGVADIYGPLVRGLDIPERVKFVIFAGVPRRVLPLPNEPRPYTEEEEDGKIKIVHHVDAFRLVLSAIVTTYEEKDPALSHRAGELLAKLRNAIKRVGGSRGDVSRAIEAIVKKQKASEEEQEEGKKKRREERYLELLNVLNEISDFLKPYWNDDNFWRSLEEAGQLKVKKYTRGDEVRMVLMIADDKTYIQASGRASRLYGSGFTKGLSFIFVDSVSLLNGLAKKLRGTARWFRLQIDEDVKELVAKKGFKVIDPEVLDRNIRESMVIDFDYIHNMKEYINKQREELSKAVGEHGKDFKASLFIIEAPGKLKTISSIFGKATVKRYKNIETREIVIPAVDRKAKVAGRLVTLVATRGHVFDLTYHMSRNIELPALDLMPNTIDAELVDNYFGVVRIDFKLDPRYVEEKELFYEKLTFFIPVFDSIREGEENNIIDKFGIIEDLRKIAWEVDEIIIATDDDREGEKIGWDIAAMLAPINSNIKRIRVREITHAAITEALDKIDTPKEDKINESILYAQLVRRIEDRWGGFTLSPLLWCKFWPHYCRTDVLRGLLKPGKKDVPIDVERGLEKLYETVYSYLDKLSKAVVAKAMSSSEEKEKIKNEYGIAVDDLINLVQSSSKAIEDAIMEKKTLMFRLNEAVAAKNKKAVQEIEARIRELRMKINEYFRNVEKALGGFDNALDLGKVFLGATEMAKIRRTGLTTDRINCKYYEENLEFNYNLSAGRVQTPALGFVVQRDDERKETDVLVVSVAREQTINDQKVDVLVETPRLLRSSNEGLYIKVVREIFGEVPKIRTRKGEKEKRKDVKVLLKNLDDAKELVIPPPMPFNTDELILESSRRLGYSASKTMAIAEDLYNRGLITYPRTESHEVDHVGLRIAREYLDSIGQGHLFVGRTYKTSETYPHIAIRPTSPTDAETIRELKRQESLGIATAFVKVYSDQGTSDVYVGDLPEDHIRLYDLIFRRFIASQMVVARVVESAYSINVVHEDGRLVPIPDAEGKTTRRGYTKIIEEGFLSIYRNVLIQRHVYDVPLNAVAVVYKTYTQPRMTDGELINLMKKSGIGRPSTYAEIVRKLLKRKYVYRPDERDEKKKKESTELETKALGKSVYAYLTNPPKALKHISNIVALERTRDLESRLDTIERCQMPRESKIDWQREVAMIYKELAPFMEPISAVLSGDFDNSLVIALMAACKPYLNLQECLNNVNPNNIDAMIKKVYEKEDAHGKMVLDVILSDIDRIKKLYSSMDAEDIEAYMSLLRALRSLEADIETVYCLDKGRRIREGVQSIIKEEQEAIKEGVGATQPQAEEEAGEQEEA